MKKLILFCSILLLPLFGCEEKPPNTPSKSSNFTGRFTVATDQNGTLPVIGCSADFVSEQLEGRGTFDDLGTCSVILTHCIDPVAAPAGGDTTVIEIVNGSMIIHQKSGDEVHLTYTGSIFKTPNSTFLGDFVISGGEGAYVNAVGEGTFEGQVHDLTTRNMTVVLDGNLAMK